jgi:hypothetical protein
MVSTIRHNWTTGISESADLGALARYSPAMAGNPRRVDTRIGHDARAAATRTLDAALRDGRFDLAEYERRLVIVQSAKVQKDLTPAIADLPAGSGRPGPALRISAADRERALVLLADALTDGRIEARAYADAEELLSRAVTYADVDAVVSNLDAKASHTERDQAVARIEAAVAAGLLEPAEQHDRVAAVRRATTDAQLAALVADLPVGAGAARSPRASHADREAVIARLHDAVEAGLIDLSEFDERTRAVYAARLRDELSRVVADLPEPPAKTTLPGPATSPAPRTSPPPALPAGLSPRKALDRAFQTVGTVGTIGLFFVVFMMIALGRSGSPGLAFLLLAAVVAVYALWGVRRIRAARARMPHELVLNVVDGHEGDFASLTSLVLPDGTPVGITGGEDNTTKVWDLTDGSLRHTLNGHTHDVKGVAAMVLPDGVPVAVTVSSDRTAKVWDLRDGSQRGVLPKSAKDLNAVRCLSLADGTPVAVAHNSDDTIQMWDLRDRKMLAKLLENASFSKMVPVVVPDGTPVALLTDWEGELKAVNLKTGKRLFQLRGHTQSINSIDTAVLPDGTSVVVTASEDKTVRIWDLRRRALLHTIDGMAQAKEAVVCTSTPDGTPVAVAVTYHGKTAAWDLRDGSELPYQLDLWGSNVTAVALPDRTLVLARGHGGGTYPLSVLPLT